MIDWENIYKIRIANPDDSFQKHEIVKLLICMKILKKYKRKSWIRLYTEHNLNNGSGLKPDVMFQNLREKSVICFEIQKKVDEKYVKNRVERYNKVDIPYFKSVDLIIVPLGELSNDIIILNKQLDKYII